MTLGIPAALPVTAMLSTLAPSSRAGPDATSEPRTNSVSSALGSTTAQTLREQAATVAAKTIDWTPWKPVYTSDHTWTGYWLNTIV
jgi:hypothetical protein